MTELTPQKIIRFKGDWKVLKERGWVFEKLFAGNRICYTYTFKRYISPDFWLFRFRGGFMTFGDMGRYSYLLYEHILADKYEKIRGLSENHYYYPDKVLDVVTGEIQERSKTNCLDFCLMDYPKYGADLPKEERRAIFQKITDRYRNVFIHEEVVDFIKNNQDLFEVVDIPEGFSK